MLSSVSRLPSCSHLKTDQLAKLEYELSGCFASRANTVTLYRKNGSTYATLEYNGERLQEVPLSKPQVNSFDVFVRQLSAFREELGCTNTEYYKLYTRSTTVAKRDGSCSWNGFDKLLKELLGIE